MTPERPVPVAERNGAPIRQRRLTIETTDRPIAREARLRGNLPLIVAVHWHWAADSNGGRRNISRQFADLSTPHMRVPALKFTQNAIFRAARQPTRYSYPARSTKVLTE